MPSLAQILRDATTIAVVGLSDKPSRTSYAIARYLQTVGYRVLPINPTINAVLGETAYPDLEHLPDDVDIDIVNVFRRAEHTADVVRMTRDYAEATGTRPAIWTQLGVSSEEAETLAEEADLPYVRNRCIMVEHRRLRT
jgi:hypothetical protein